MDLKKIFKRIHPDLFHDKEVQRSTNEKSFQYLSQFLDGNQTENYSLHFYFYDDNQNLKQTKVEFVAPPPYADSNAIKSHVIRYLKILTLAIELDLEAVFGRDHEKNAAEQTKNEIITFLKDNLADARRKSDDYNRENKLIDDLKKELEYEAACKVMVSSSLGYTKCKDLLEDLCKRAAEVREFRLRDQYLYFIDDGYFSPQEISIEGDMIRIPVSFEANDVLEFLRQNHAEARQKAEKHRNQKEFSEAFRKLVQHELKLRYLGQSVFCKDEDFVVALETLQSIASELKALGIKGLTFTMADRNTVEDNGTFYLAANMEAHELLAFVRNNVEKAHTLRNQEAIYELEIRQLEGKIKTELPLYIYSSFDITKPNYIYALENIIQALPFLKGFDFGGNSLCISTEFKVSNYGTIYIPYDFNVDDLRDFLPQSEGLKQLK